MKLFSRGKTEEGQQAPSSHGSGSAALIAKIILTALFIALTVKAFFIEAFRIPTSSMENTLLPGDMILVNKTAYHIATPVQLPFFTIPLQKRVLFATGSINRFDVVTFTHPGEQEEIVPSQQTFYIKRLIALPGETISMQNKKVFINGSPLNENGHCFFTNESRDAAMTDDRIFPRGMEWNRDYYGPFTLPYKGMVIHFSASNFIKYRIIIARELGSSVVWEQGKVFCNGRQLSSYTFTENYYFAMGDNRDDSFDSRFWGPVPEKNIQGKAALIYLSFEPFSSGFWSSIRWNRTLQSIR